MVYTKNYLYHDRFAPSSVYTKFGLSQERFIPKNLAIYAGIIPAMNPNSYAFFGPQNQEKAICLIQDGTGNRLTEDGTGNRVTQDGIGNCLTQDGTGNRLWIATSVRPSVRPFTRSSICPCCMLSQLGVGSVRIH